MKKQMIRVVHYMGQEYLPYPASIQWEIKNSAWEDVKITIGEGDIVATSDDGYQTIEQVGVVCDRPYLVKYGLDVEGESTLLEVWALAEFIR